MIDIADEAYADGFVYLYFCYPETDHGDTLAEFIVRELKDTVDQTAPRKRQCAEAKRVLELAVRELQAVADAF